MVLSSGLRSVVVRIPLQGVAVDHDVALNDCGVLTLITHNWRPVEVDLVVNDKKWVVVVDNVVIHADTIQVLLE